MRQPQDTADLATLHMVLVWGRELGMRLDIPQSNAIGTTTGKEPPTPCHRKRMHTVRMAFHLTSKFVTSRPGEIEK